MVAEVAAFCAGESDPTDDARDAVVERLARVATSHSDALVREAAVAALGSIGAAGGRAAVLAACSDVAAVLDRGLEIPIVLDRSTGLPTDIPRDQLHAEVAQRVAQRGSSDGWAFDL